MAASDDLLAAARADKRTVPLERIGVDRFTGKVLVGEGHERQSVGALLTTRFHERLIRRGVGSFIMHMAGASNTTPMGILRLSWGVAASVDLWEPNWTVKRVSLTPGGNSENAVNAGGMSIKIDYDRNARAHLGERAVAESRKAVYPSGAWGGLPL